MRSHVPRTVSAKTAKRVCPFRYRSRWKNAPAQKTIQEQVSEPNSDDRTKLEALIETGLDLKAFARLRIFASKRSNDFGAEAEHRREPPPRRFAPSQ